MRPPVVRLTWRNAASRELWPVYVRYDGVTHWGSTDGPSMAAPSATVDDLVAGWGFLFRAKVTHLFEVRSADGRSHVRDPAE